MRPTTAQPYLSQLFLLFAAVAALTNEVSMAEFIELLSFLSSTLVAGLIASWLITQVRAGLPAPKSAEQWRSARRLKRIAWAALYAPRYARWLSLALAGLISLLASLSAALLTGSDATPLLDAALAAIVGQLRHSLMTSAEIKPRENADGH